MPNNIVWNRSGRVAAALVFALSLLLLLGTVLVGIGPQQAKAAPAEQVAAPRTVTLYGPTAVTTGTTYSAAPLTVNGQDFSRVTNYKSADVFVATDAGSSGTVTVTVQGSADQATWANVIDVVHTFSSTGTLINTNYTYRVVLAGASASGLIRAPLAGEFVRVSVEAAGAVTPTVKATYR